MVFFECIAIGFGYGVDNFYQNIYEMIGYYPNKFWKFCWIIITPTMCLMITAFSLVKYEPMKYKNYEYPWYGNAFGWLLSLSSIIWIPVYAIYKLISHKGDFKNILRQEVYVDCEG